MLCYFRLGKDGTFTWKQGRPRKTYPNESTDLLINRTKTSERMRGAGFEPANPSKSGSYVHRLGQTRPPSLTRFCTLTIMTVSLSRRPVDPFAIRGWALRHLGFRQSRSSTTPRRCSELTLPDPPRSTSFSYLTTRALLAHRRVLSQRQTYVAIPCRANNGDTFRPDPRTVRNSSRRNRPRAHYCRARCVRELSPPDLRSRCLFGCVESLDDGRMRR